MSCSRTQQSASGKSQTHDTMVLMLTVYQLSHCAPILRLTFTEFIQASMSKIQGLFKDFSSLCNSFQGLKLMKNTDLSVRILLQKC